MNLDKWRKLAITCLHKLDHDQRKQAAAALNNIATLIVVQYFIQRTGIIAIMMLVVAGLLWFLSIKIVRKGKGE